MVNLDCPRHHNLPRLGWARENQINDGDDLSSLWSRIHCWFGWNFIPQLREKQSSATRIKTLSRWTKSLVRYVIKSCPRKISCFNVRHVHQLDAVRATTSTKLCVTSSSGQAKTIRIYARRADRVGRERRRLPHRHRQHRFATTMSVPYAINSLNSRPSC